LIEECYNSEGPNVREAWHNLMPGGRMPTPEEFVLSGAMKLLGPRLAAQQAEKLLT